MSVQQVPVARYVHEARGQVFEIDVIPMTLTSEDTARFFVAYVSRLDRGELVPVTNALGLREVFGPTESWAFQNACDLLDCGGWRADRDGGSRAALRPVSGGAPWES
jgi:hypothetical protein